MPSIQGGSPQFQPLRSAQGSQPPQGAVQKAATEQAPTDHVRLSQSPSQTTQNVQRQQLLTADTTQARIQQLLKNGQPNLQLERPSLSILQRSSMASALAQTLAGQHVPDLPQTQNPYAQTAAGQQQTASAFRSQVPSETQDTAWQRAAGSGRRLKKDDKEAEFSMMDDSSGEGMSGQSTADDQRSGAQKQKMLLEVKRRQQSTQEEHTAFIQKPKQKLPPVPAQNPLEAGYRPIPPKNELKKPDIKKPEVKRMNTLQQKSSSPGKKPKADEWDL